MSDRPKTQQTHSPRRYRKNSSPSHVSKSNRRGTIKLEIANDIVSRITQKKDLKSRFVN